MVNRWPIRPGMGSPAGVSGCAVELSRRTEQEPRPPLPRRSDHPRRPASHRKPRRRIGPLLTGYALATLAGAMTHPLLTLLS